MCCEEEIIAETRLLRDVDNLSSQIQEALRKPALRFIIHVPTIHGIHSQNKQFCILFQGFHRMLVLERRIAMY